MWRTRAESLRLASVAGLNIDPVADKLLDYFERFIAIKWAKPNSALTGLVWLPAAVVAHLALSEMCSGTLPMHIAIDEVRGHVRLEAQSKDEFAVSWKCLQRVKSRLRRHRL
jgi:hypothetical protein